MFGDLADDPDFSPSKKISVTYNIKHDLSTGKASMLRLRHRHLVGFHAEGERFTGRRYATESSNIAPLSARWEMRRPGARSYLPRALPSEKRVYLISK